MGREDRFRKLFESHYHRVLGYAIRRIDRREDAEDVVAETFAVAWRRLDDVPAGDDARPWLLAVARGQLANQRRGAGRRARLVERIGMTAATGAERPTRGGGAGQVAEAFAELRGDDREVLALLAWEELTPAEIAVVLGCSPGAARKRVHRARRRMARLMESAAAARPAPAPYGLRGSEKEET